MMWYHVIQYKWAHQAIIKLIIYLLVIAWYRRAVQLSQLWLVKPRPSLMKSRLVWTYCISDITESKCDQYMYLENDHATVMASCKQVEGWMGCQDPKAIMFPAESVEADSLGHIPHTDRFVLRIWQDQLLPWMEHYAGHIVIVTTASVNLPGLEKFTYMNWY